MQNLSPQRFFLFVAGFFGLIYIFLIPPFQTPDEENHFKYAYFLSEGNLSGVQQNDRLGGEIPLSIEQIADIYRPLRYDQAEKNTPERRRQTQNISLNSSEVGFVDFPNTGFYTPFPYLPQVAFLALVKPLDCRPVYLLYACRVVCLLVWMFLIYHSIKKIPERKWLWLVLALLPSSLFINSGAGGDVLTNGIAFLLIAMIVDLVLVPQSVLTRKNILLIALLVALLVTNKFVYTPIVCLLYFVPKRKVDNHQSLVVFLSIFVLLLFVIVYKHTSTGFIPYDLYNPQYRDGKTINPGVNPLEQLAFVLSNPILFVKTMLLTWWDLLPANVAHYFGKFGWGKNYLPAPVILFLVLLTTGAATFEEKNKYNYPELWKVALLGISLVILTMLSLTIYMLWNKVAAERVGGLMGRYFFPFFPLIWLALPRFSFFSENKFLPIVRYGLIAALLIGVGAVFERYYL